MIQRITALLLLFVLSPLFVLLYLLVKATSSGSFLFTQQRLGKNKQPFIIYKIRTMIPNAEDQKQHYTHLNETDGPVFKIRNDPRYTKIGKILSHTGLDELPQLFNVARGDMALVGPRPLPVGEAKQIPDRYLARFRVLPGITSPWVVQGAHQLSFDEWMALDLWYVKHQSWSTDVSVSIQTIQLLSKMIWQKITQSI